MILKGVKFIPCCIIMPGKLTRIYYVPLPGCTALKVISFDVIGGNVPIEDKFDHIFESLVCGRIMSVQISPKPITQR